MLKTWLLSLWYIRLLKQQANNPNKVKLETDSLRSECVNEIITKTQSLWISLKKLKYQLGIKKVQDVASLVYRDDLGGEVKLTKPIFSSNQVARIRRTYWLYHFVGIVLVAGETGLYYLIAVLFVPGTHFIVQAIVAFFITLVLMFSLSGAIEEYVRCEKAIERQKNGGGLPMPIHLYKSFRFLGYTLLFTTSAAILLGAVSRIYFLEQVDVSGLEPERAKNVTTAVRYGAVFSLLLTISATIYLAILKKKLSEYSEKFSVYRAWKKSHKRRNKYAQSAIRKATMLLLIIEQTVEKYWQIVIDVKRVYKLPSEIDEQFTDLHREYSVLKSQPNFRLTEAQYWKFSPIQAAHEDLFQYGILAKKSIQERIQFCIQIIEEQQHYIQQESNPTPETQQAQNLNSPNGNHTKQLFEPSKSKKQ